MLYLPLVFGFAFTHDQSRRERPVLAMQVTTASSNTLANTNNIVPSFHTSNISCQWDGIGFERPMEVRPVVIGKLAMFVE
jgi:hypothetical protein